ncbi:hypothetical protein [Nonomuraea ceibae]|uniref:hypothetical protein n=1 Tax=Nonomuraea ceibae TaxID=1935170 RepID=UPI001C5D80D9|nr:hypothetical protein [Nonomuraea ceibae]
MSTLVRLEGDVSTTLSYVRPSAWREPDSVAAPYRPRARAKPRDAAEYRRLLARTQSRLDDLDERDESEAP